MFNMFASTDRPNHFHRIAVFTCECWNFGIKNVLHFSNHEYDCVCSLALTKNEPDCEVYTVLSSKVTKYLDFPIDSSFIGLTTSLYTVSIASTAARPCWTLSFGYSSRSLDYAWITFITMFTGIFIANSGDIL